MSSLNWGVPYVVSLVIWLYCEPSNMVILCISMWTYSWYVRMYTIKDDCVNKCLTEFVGTIVENGEISSWVWGEMSQKVENCGMLCQDRCNSEDLAFFTTREVISCNTLVACWSVHRYTPTCHQHSTSISDCSSDRICLKHSSSISDHSSDRICLFLAFS